MGYKLPVSYSGLSLYRQCPKAWHSSYILGVRSPSNKYADRGTMLHAKLELYFKTGDWNSSIGENKVLAPWKGYMEHLYKTSPGTPEVELASSIDWKRGDYSDMTMNVRGKIDLLYRPEGKRVAKWGVIDWKSGKTYASHSDQSDFYACLVDSYGEPGEAMFVYLDSPQDVVVNYYSPSRVESLREELSKEIAILRNDEEHLPTPSESSCKYCTLSWRNGGDCFEAA